MLFFYENNNKNDACETAQRTKSKNGKILYQGMGLEGKEGWFYRNA